MTDGPNFEQLFKNCQCLNAEANLKYIVNYLRFYKNDGAYQSYLTHYLPMLAKPEYAEYFEEFVADVTDKERKEEMKALYDKSIPLDPAKEAEKAAKEKAKAEAKAVKEAEKAKK